MRLTWILQMYLLQSLMPPTQATLLRIVAFSYIHAVQQLAGPM